MYILLQPWGWRENAHKHYYYKTVNNCRVWFWFLNLTFPPLIMDSLSSHEQFKFTVTVVSIRIKAVWQKITDLGPPLLKTTGYKELQFLQFYMSISKFISHLGKHC